MVNLQALLESFYFTLFLEKQKGNQLGPIIYNCLHLRKINKLMLKHEKLIQNRSNYLGGLECTLQTYVYMDSVKSVLFAMHRARVFLDYH